MKIFVLRSLPIDAIRKGKAMADSPPVEVAADASGSAEATETADDAHFINRARVRLKAASKVGGSGSGGSR